MWDSERHLCSRKLTVSWLLVNHNRMIFTKKRLRAGSSYQKRNRNNRLHGQGVSWDTLESSRLDTFVRSKVRLAMPQGRQKPDENLRFSNDSEGTIQSWFEQDRRIAFCFMGFFKLGIWESDGCRSERETAMDRIWELLKCRTLRRRLPLADLLCFWIESERSSVCDFWIYGFITMDSHIYKEGNTIMSPIECLFPELWSALWIDGR